jgi:serine/threonine-protein kinase
MQFETLGSYEILREWGRSAAGRVLLARDPETDSGVAIQLVETLSDLADDEREQGQDRLLRGCSAIVGMKHANVVAVTDVDEADGVPYVVTEHIEGTPFATYCRADSLLPAWTVVDLVAGAARGLGELHRAGLVHGAVRPEWLLRVGNVGMVAGVGLAACLPAGEGAGLRGASAYLSPEQVRNEPVDGRSDLFALGAVLYEMLTGRKAFPGESISTVLFRIVNEEVRDPAALDPPVGAPLAEILLRALAKQKEDRFESGERFAEELEEAAVALRVDEFIAPESARPIADEDRPISDAGATSASPSRASARPFVLGSLLVALVAVAAFWLLQDRGGDDGASVAWLEARVSTQPPDLPVRLDGETVEVGDSGLIRFRAEEPFGVLTASFECRTAEHRLGLSDAGGELVLVLDPVEVEVPLDPAVDGARVLLNGEPVGTTPAEVKLDLCSENRLELRAPGYRAATAEIPAGAEPLAARKLVYALALEPIPKGRLALPRKKGLELVYYVDGKRIGKSVTEVELEEGEHELRFKNEFHWIDERTKLRVAGGETTTPGVDPRIATLAVQAYPSNCKVYLRRPGGGWRYLDETPAERRVATGSYEVKVQLNPTGETRISKVELKEGANPPLRVAFGEGR